MKRFVAIVAGLAVAVSGLVVSAPEAQAAGLSGSATSATAGQPMLVNASGFIGNEKVRFSLSGPQSVSLGELPAISGSVHDYLLVPSSTVAGVYTLMASGVSSGMMATSPVTVSSPYRLLRFDANGGSVSPGSRSALAGATLGSLPTPSRAGYTFKGWFTARSGGAKVTSTSRMGSADRTLYAHWSGKKYTVKFSANGGKKPSSKSKRVTMGKSYGKLPSVKRTGYSFLGWFTAKSGGVKVTSGSTFTKAANQSLFAHWKAKSYKVKLKAQGGKVSKSSIRVTYHATYKSLPTPSRSGYSFKGWYTKKSGGTKITNSSKVKITKTHTLYAQWKKAVTMTANSLGSKKFGATEKSTLAALTKTLGKPKLGAVMYNQCGGGGYMRSAQWGSLRVWFYSDVNIKTSTRYFGAWTYTASSKPSAPKQLSSSIPWGLSLWQLEQKYPSGYYQDNMNAYWIGNYSNQVALFPIGYDDWGNYNSQYGIWAGRVNWCD